MPGFIGGSAPAMVAQIAEGYFLINQNTLRGWAKGDLQNLRAELDKALREVRATVPPQDDARQNQVRNCRSATGRSGGSIPRSRSFRAR